MSDDLLFRVRTEKRMSKSPSSDFLVKGGLDSVEWVQQVHRAPGAHVVLSVGAMSSSNGGVDPDHMFLSMLKQDLIKDLQFIWNSETREFHTIIALGADIAGHPRITHGGFSAAVLDETTGGLVFEGKKDGSLGPGRAFTARLEVDYKQPMSTNIEIICTARIASVEGRKIWTEAELRDRPGGTLYAVARALYVTAKTDYVARDQEQEAQAA